MNTPRPRGQALPWEELRSKLDHGPSFNAMRNTPYYRDAVYEQFSPQEYARRHAALRARMQELNLDAVIANGGPSHWSFGGGMLWLSGHWEWHALANYVVFPKEGEPTLVYSMGGTHCEAVRQETKGALNDVRSSRGGKFGEVIAERLKELGYERGRIGLTEIDPRHGDYMPVNQYNTLRESLPGAELVFTKGIMHELLSIHSAEELDCIRTAGVLCTRAMEAMRDRMRPGVTDYQLRAAAGAAILEGNGDIDFLILGSTPMANPAMVFGSPRPSGRVLQKGDIVNMELAAGYRGYTAQIGQPICLGEPPADVRRFWDEIAEPGYARMIEEIRPGNRIDQLRVAGEFFREKGVQSRPVHCHGIDLITDGPHVFQDHIDVKPFEEVMRPGMVIMAEPNPITMDGMLGMFVGHTFIVTDKGRECVDTWPVELTVVKA
jgi:Xaa-Pro aminopeptidase